MKKLLTTALALIFAIIPLLAQPQIQEFPVDPEFTVGKLDNGLTYYIRHNALPENRAEFYLATHVGALQETPDQDGLAHFLEHMCFNGTKNFPAKTLLDYLQSIGASFGGNINASTGIEQTVYMLNNMPLTRPAIIDSCLLVMHDYSHFVLLEPKEIDAERGVILEEKRTRNNAQWRNFMESRKYLYKGSHLSEISLIGSEENLKTFKPESIENFYHTWYRPDMQALIVVGDIDVKDIENRIKTIFADIPAAENPKAKEQMKVPDNDTPIVGIIADKETVSTSVEIDWKREPMPRAYRNTAIGFSTDLAKGIVSTIINERLDEIAAKPDAPFIKARGGMGSAAECMDVVSIEGTCKDSEALGCLEALYTEALKIKKFGFTDDEVKRAKDEVLSQMESRAKSASTRKNSEFIWPAIGHFFNNDYLLSPEDEYKFAKMIMPQITAAPISQAIAEAITDNNIVAIIYTPEKEGVTIPTEEQVLEVFAKVKASDIQAPAAEAVPAAFLDAAKLKGSAIASTKEAPYGATLITLKNGLKVILKPTDKEKDVVSFNISKKGGKSLLSDEELYDVDNNVWSLYVKNTGISSFSSTTVSKMLSGKQASASPYIGSYTSGVRGSSTPKDLETALQIAYLYYMQPRFDADEYNQGINQIKAILPNLVNQPNYKLNDQLYKTFYDTPRVFMISEETVAKASLKGLQKVYGKLFDGVNGATMIIVGDFCSEDVIPLVQKYMGSIKKGKASDWKYNGDGYVDGQKINDFTAVMEQPKVSVLQAYKANKPYSVEAEVSYEALTYMMDMLYTETLREEEGGTYGASAMEELGQQPDEYRSVMVYFDTNEEQADKLREIAKDGLKKFAEEGPSAEYFDRTVKNFEKKISEKRIRNSYWASALSQWDKYGIDYDAEYEAAVKALTPEKVKEVAAELVNSGNFGELIMRPQK